MRRTFVIGDIHGCYKTLLAMLAKISPDPADDVLVFLGDYIDRGPDSQKVIAELLQLRNKFANFIALGSRFISDDGWRADSEKLWSQERVVSRMQGQDSAGSFNFYQ